MEHAWLEEVMVCGGNNLPKGHIWVLEQGWGSDKHRDRLETSDFLGT